MSRESKRWYQDRIKYDPKWKEAKDKAFKRLDRWECRLCGHRRNLEWHHLSYKRLGEKNEYKDLRILCTSCHRKCHYVFFFIRLPLTPLRLTSRYYLLLSQKRIKDILGF